MIKTAHAIRRKGAKPVGMEGISAGAETPEGAEFGRLRSAVRRQVAEPR
jgi:hypothetical protein